MLEEPEYLRGFDKLKFALGVSLATTVALFFVPRGSSTGVLADNLSTIFGPLTLALIIAMIVRVILRRKRGQPQNLKGPFT